MLRIGLQRLCDPSEVAAATCVALCLLTWEAVLCPLIVWAVQCAISAAPCTFHIFPAARSCTYLPDVVESHMRAHHFRFDPFCVRRHGDRLGGVHAAERDLPAGELTFLCDRRTSASLLPVARSRMRAVALHQSRHRQTAARGVRLQRFDTS